MSRLASRLQYRAGRPDRSSGAADALRQHRLDALRSDSRAVHAEPGGDRPAAPTLQSLRLDLRAMHRPAVFTVPEFALRMALGREMADEMLLASERVKPARLQQMGFEFQYAELGMALEHVLHSNSQ